MASLGLEKEVLSNYIASEIENRAGEKTVLSLLYLMELNTEEDETLFFECFKESGASENDVKTSKNLRPLVKKRLLLRD